MRSRRPGSVGSKQIQCTKSFNSHSQGQELTLPPQSGWSARGLCRASLSAEAGDTPAVSPGNLSPPDSTHPAMVKTIRGLFTQPPSVGIVGPMHPPRA